MEVLKEKNKMEEYPSRQDIKELIMSPVRDVQEWKKGLLEEKEILEHHYPLGTPPSLSSKGSKGKMFLDCDT